MRLLCLLTAGAGIGIGALVTACGGGIHHPSTTGPLSSPSTTSQSASRSSVRPPPGFAGRLLQNGQLTGYTVADVAAYTSPAALISSEQLNPADARAETGMLARTGFQMAAREDLNHQGAAALSVAERLASPAGARAALSFYVARFQHLGGRSGEFALFPVRGVPGAVGFRLGQAGSAGSNVAFASGDYYYLLGEEGAGPGPENGLGAAARRLYARVTG